MLRKIELLIPPFLKRLDQQLLLNRPGLWTTKIHYVLFFGGIGLLLLLIKATLTPLSLSDIPNPGTHFMVLLIPIIIGFGVYVFRLSLFNVEKQFGQTAPGRSLRDQLIFAATIGLLALMPFAYSYILSDKIAAQVSNEQLSADINALNLGDLFFPEDVYLYDKNVKENGEYHYDTYDYEGYSPFYSEVLIDIRSPREIKQIHTNHTSQEEKLQQISNFKQAFAKYSGTSITYSSETILGLFDSRQILQMRHLGELKAKARSNIENLLLSKEKNHLFHDREVIHATAFSLAGIWLMLLIFLKTRPRNFLWAIVGGIVVLFMGGTVLSLFRVVAGIYPEIVLWPMFMATLAFFIYQGYRKKNSRRSNHWKAISLILAAMMLPFLPLVTLTMDKYISQQEAWFALDLGIMLAFIVWNLAFSHRFTKLRAMPTEN